MRHGKKFNHLGRTTSHRKAMLSNMAASLIENKRIATTVAKAKALRKYVEPLITKSKTDTTHSRRVVFSYLQSKEAVKELFGGISEKISTREGGYTRIIKTGNRLGDAAEMCIIELVDYNEIYLNDGGSKKKTRRSRRGASTSTPTAKAETTEEVVTEVVEVASEAVEAESTSTQESDDLTKIVGIGKVYQGKLNTEGIFTYEDVANMTEEQIQLMEEKYTFKGDFKDSIADVKKIIADKKA